MWKHVESVFGESARSKERRLKRHEKAFEQSKANFAERMRTSPFRKDGYKTYHVKRDEFHDVATTKYGNNPTIVTPNRLSYDHLEDLEKENLKTEEKEKSPKMEYETHDIWKVSPIPIRPKAPFSSHSRESSGQSSKSAASNETLPETDGFVRVPDFGLPVQGKGKGSKETWCGVRVEPSTHTADDLHFSRTKVWEEQAARLDKSARTNLQHADEEILRKLTAQHIEYSDLHCGSPAENIQRGFHVASQNVPVPLPTKVVSSAPVEIPSSQASQPSPCDSTMPGSVAKSSLSDSVGEMPAYMTMGFYDTFDACPNDTGYSRDGPSASAVEKHRQLACKLRSSYEHQGDGLVHQNKSRKVCSAPGRITPGSGDLHEFSKMTAISSRKSSVSLLSKTLGPPGTSSLGMSTFPDEMRRRTQSVVFKPCRMHMQGEDDAEEAITSESEADKSSFDDIDWNEPLTPVVAIAEEVTMQRARARIVTIPEVKRGPGFEERVQKLKASNAAKAAEKAKRDEAARNARTHFAIYQEKQRAQEAFKKNNELQRAILDGTYLHRKKARSALPNTPVTAHREKMKAKEPEPFARQLDAAKLDPEAQLADFRRRMTTPQLPEVKTPSGVYRTRYTEEELAEERRRGKRWGPNYVIPDHDLWTRDALSKDPATRDCILYDSKVTR